MQSRADSATARVALTAARNNKMTIRIIYHHHPESTTVEAEQGDTLLEVAQRSGIPIPANCGGQGACGACHVIVKKGMAALSPAEDTEEDTLDLVEGLTESSRLACQAILQVSDKVDDHTVEVEIPERSKGRPGIIE